MVKKRRKRGEILLAIFFIQKIGGIKQSDNLN